MSQCNDNYRDFYSLYQLYSNGKDLKEFCIESGINYSKFTDWQRKQVWNEQFCKVEELKESVMLPLNVVGSPSSSAAVASAVASTTTSGDELVKNPIRSVRLELCCGTKLQMRNVTLLEVMSTLQKLLG